MDFKTVADFFDKIKKESSRNKKTELLATLFSLATPEEAKILAYISEEQLNPPYIGTQFNIAEKNMYKIIAQFIDVPIEEIKEKYNKIGDLGLLLEDYKWEHKSDLSLENVYSKLSEIENIRFILLP